MFIKKVQIYIGCLLIILGIVYISCKDDGDDTVSNSGPVCNNYLCETGETFENCPSDCCDPSGCNNNGTCDGDETLMCCPQDCWDITKTIACRAAYNETRMSCMDYKSLDVNEERNTKIEQYNLILNDCDVSISEQYCQFENRKNCIFSLTQERTCLEQVCTDTGYHVVCYIEPNDATSDPIQTFTIPQNANIVQIGVWPNDPTWVISACEMISGTYYGTNDVSCDLY